MKWHLLATAAAAALIAGSGAAFAQDNPGKSGDQMQMDQQKSDEQRAPDQGSPDRMNGNQRDMRGDQTRDMQQDKSGDMRQDRTHATTTRTTTRTLTTVQKTRIRSAVIERPDAPRISHVNFTIRVGIAVPRSVRVVPVPEEIVTIYPQWAGFNYFIDGDEIVIVDPNTFAIVGTFYA